MELSSSSIRQLRCQMGWSRSDLAHHLGVQSQEISMWEEGKASPCTTCQRSLEALFHQGEFAALAMVESSQIDALMQEGDQSSINRDQLQKLGRVKDRIL